MYVYSVLCRMLPVSALAIPNPLLLMQLVLAFEFPFVCSFDVQDTT